MKSCDDGYPSCRQAEATGKFCTGRCAATKYEQGPEMTNTQSPAPGVAAEVMRLMDLVGDYAEAFKDKDLNEARAVWNKLEGEISTSLQASAATVEPVAWKWEVLPGTEHYKRKGNKEGVYLEDPATLGIPMNHPSYRWTKLYTAPPLPAQVQAAETGIAEKLRAALAELLTRCEEVKAALDKDISLGEPVHPLSSRLTWPMSTAIGALREYASRTPAQGMATELSDEALIAVQKGIGQTFLSHEARIMLMRAAIAADRALRGAPGMAGGVVPSGLMALLVELQDAGYCDVDGDFQYTLPSAVREAVKAHLAAPHPSPAPQAVGAIANMRGLHVLRGAIAMLREEAVYRDDEGEDTDALEELLAAIEAGRAGS